MCKSARRTHGTAAGSVPVADLLASEARRALPTGPRAHCVQRPLSTPFPGRSIERVLRDLATPSNNIFFVFFNIFLLFLKAQSGQLRCSLFLVS